MDLIQELKKAGVVWTIESIEEKSYGSVICKMALPGGESTEFKCSPGQFRRDSNPLNMMLILCLKKIQKESGVRPEVLRQWYESHGNYRARLQPDVHPADAFTHMHVAMRKLMDGMNSVVLWNGFHALDDETTDGLGKLLEEEITEATRGSGSVENLHLFAVKLRDKIATFFKDRAATARNESHPTATIFYSLAYAFEQLSGDDCAFGLLGYIFERENTVSGL